jgi:hypothetical protein
MKEHNAPNKFWDYACEYVTELINHSATRCLAWRTPYESLHGETLDFSIFRYSFYEPIYYMDPSAKFLQHNMLPGHFLGIAHTSGDSFTFIISQVNNITGCVLHCSVIRKRSPTVLQTHADYQVPTLSTLPEVSTISDHDTMTSDTMIESLPFFDISQSLPNDGMIEAIVDTKSIHDGTEHPYLVHLEPVQPQPLEHANSIYDHFDHHDLKQILGIEHNPSTGTLYAKVQWKNLQESFIPLVTLQEEQPSLLATYILLNPVERTRSGYWNTWAQTTQRNISNVTRKLRRIHGAITQHHNFFPTAIVLFAERRSISLMYNHI